MNKKKIILAIILLLALFLRFYKIEINPPSLNLDEVAIGYNAYSILKTGRDEYGTYFPLAFRSHDDYKPPLYIYLTVPSVAIFGLTDFAVRFPSAFFGSLTVLMLYAFVKELFKGESKEKYLEKKALLAALFLALNPWHLQFSRAGFETNLALFLILSGIFVFMKGISNPKFWRLTAVLFALSLYSYHTARLFVPLISLFLLMIYFSSIKNNLRQAVIAFIIFFAAVIPLVPLAFSTEGLMRFKGTSIFEHPGIIEQEAQRKMSDAQRQDQLAIKIFHNHRVAGLLTVFNGYLKHFHPDLLFMGGKGPPYNYTPNIGLFYLFELPLIIWGSHLILKNSINPKYLLIFWLILSPIASALTWDIPSSTRTMPMLPPIIIFSAIGGLDLFNKLKYAKKYYKILLAIFLLTSIFNITYYLHQYHVHAPIENSDIFQFGYKQAVEFAESQKQNFDRIIVSTNLKQPQNFFAFYSKYDPQTYLDVDGGTVSGGFLESGNKFEKYEFHKIDYQNLTLDGKTLLIDLYDEMPGEYKKRQIKTINLLNGQPNIIISKT